MDIQKLAQRLRDPNPRVRVETLRILAMVEETRALGAVRWVFLHDPETGVRDVANWTGDLLWQAYQRGHTTERAMEEMFKQAWSTENQARFIESLEFDSVAGGPLKARAFAADQTFRRRLDDVLRPSAPSGVNAADALGPRATSSDADAEKDTRRDV